MKIRQKIIVLSLLAVGLLTTAESLLAVPPAYSPAYRIKSLLDENELGYTVLTTTLVIPGAEDIKGVNETGAAYNYLGIETANGNSLEIGVHRDKFDKDKEQWSVFAAANYTGAFANYDSQEKWHNFRHMPWNNKSPHLVFPSGATVVMTLKVVNNDEVLFAINNCEPIKLNMPGANINGQGQIFRRVTSIITDDETGYSQNNRWLTTSLKKSNTDYITWLPQPTEITRSNNMDINDPEDSGIIVKTNIDHYYPETIDTFVVKPARATFIVGCPDFYFNGIKQATDAAPFLQNGRVYLPIRFFAHACGLREQDIVWDNDEQKVTLYTPETQYILTVGENKLALHGQEQLLEASPILEQGRLYVPVRIIAESLGFQVNWDGSSKKVTLYPNRPTEQATL